MRKRPKGIITIYFTTIEIPAKIGLIKFVYICCIETLFSFYRSLLPLTAVVSTVQAAVRSGKLCGNVDNSYIIPALFLYQYSYTS